MIDIFNVITDTTKYNDSTINYSTEIIQSTDISKFEIDWLKFHHVFYIDRLDPYNIADLIHHNIDSDTNILDNFQQLNIKFNILNRLNVSYNNQYNYKDYTLHILQDIYIKYIISNKQIIDQLFNYIISINLDFNSKQKQLINIFKDYVSNQQKSYTNYHIRNTNTDSFVELYSRWIANYFIKQYYTSILDLDEIFTKLIYIDKINEIFLSIGYRSYFTMNVISDLILLLEPYLENILLNNLSIDIEVIKTFNITTFIGPANRYESDILEFTKKWILKINHKDMSTKDILDSLLKIQPLIHYNKSQTIAELFSSVFNIKNDLFDYLIKNINYANINYKYIDIISLISLYKDKDKLWKDYFLSVYQRLMNTIKLGNHVELNTALNIEYDMYNTLKLKHPTTHRIKYSDKIKLLLDDIKSSLLNRVNIQKCKFNFVNKQNKPLEFDKFNISLVNYTLIDNDLYNKLNNKYIQLIDNEKYPDEIIKYISVGQSYYVKLYEIYNIQFYIERSIINITVNNINIRCNIIQYTLLSFILKDTCKIEALVEYIVNKDLNIINNKKYLLSYIDNLLTIKIIKLDASNNLIIVDYENEITFDITTFSPTLMDVEMISTTIDSEDDKESIKYLRYLILVKMFKQNSTKIFKLDDILKSVIDFIKNTKLNQNLLNVFTIDKDELIRCLLYIEIRDIIEQINPNEYIYVV